MIRNKIISTHWLLTMTILALFGAASLLRTASTQAHPALAQPTPTPTQVTTCGQVLDQAGEYVLTTDLDCSGTPGDYNGVTITASDVVFHLAGHTISSSDCDLGRNISGIAVVGGITGVKIDGGVVAGFNDGVVLASSDSRVKGITVKNACLFGIAVQGENNRVETNVVTGSGSDGIMLSPATGAVIASNYSSGNKRSGVAISDFAHDNLIENNILNDNGGTGEGYGVAVFNGTNNTIRGNSANNNDYAGIRISSAENPNGNPDLGNKVIDNIVSGNAHVGIWVLAPASPSIVTSNTVLGSGETDMLDERTDCGTNVWLNNIFKTDLAGGLPDGGPGVGCIQ
jgi:parallel beta-helix repeat protein